MYRIFIALMQKEIKIVLKDYHALLALFILPVVFVLTMSYALKDASSSKINLNCEYYVDKQNIEELVLKFDKSMESLNGFTCTKSLNDKPSKSSDIFIYLPKDFFEHFANELKTTSKISLFYKPSLNQSIILLLDASIKQKVALTFTSDDDAEFTPVFAKNLEQEFVKHSSFGKKVPNSVEQSVPSWTVFAMFFVLIPLSTVLIVEKEQGTLKRLQSLRLSPFAFFASKALTYNIINITQGVLMIFVGLCIVPFLGLEPLRIDSYAATALMIFSLSVGAIGFAFLIATMSKTSGQAVVVGGLSVILIGSISGVMVPKYIMPESMQMISNLSPMSWGLDGFLTIFLSDGGVCDILKYAIFLLLFGITLFFISLILLIKQKGD